MAGLAARLAWRARVLMLKARLRLLGPPLDPGWYPVAEIAYRALRGAEAVYPGGYGGAVYGASARGGCWRVPTMDSTLLLAPPAFTPRRLEKMAELLREPGYWDVDTRGRLGGFSVGLPLAVASMGSTDVASRHSIAIARAAARHCIVYGVGENVATVRGYDARLTRGHPSLLERILAYLESLPEPGCGGVVVQQSAEDAYDELWNRLYSDKRLDPYIDEGLIGFEVKVGQGAKPGLGGVIKVPRSQAERLKAKYHLEFSGDGGYATRYSVPATFTEDILRGMIRSMRNAYPRVRVWVKLGGYRDAFDALRVAWEEGADAVVLDGLEGGTGMAPREAMEHLGLPTLAMAAVAREARRRGYRVGTLLAGGLYSGFHLTAAMALGASGMAAGRPFIIAAAVAGEKGVARYIESVRVEAQMLASALGKYSLTELSPEDIAALDPHIARALRIRYALSPHAHPPGAEEHPRHATQPRSA